MQKTTQFRYDFKLALISSALIVTYFTYNFREQKRFFSAR